MTKKEEDLLRDFTEGTLTRDELLQAFPVNIINDDAFVVREVQAAIADGSEEKLDAALSLIYLSGDKQKHLRLLERLLVTPGHRSHQEIAWQLQALKSPTSVSYVKQVLDSGFRYLSYTRSEPGVIARWLSGVLFAIKTPEAIEVLKAYANASNKEIAEQMQLRLKALGIEP